MRLLILGGTTEATNLVAACQSLPHVEPVLSLAGRTQHPVLPAIHTRIGGFGGIEGLVSYLKSANITALIDATHPFAAQMTANAEAACRLAAVPRLVLTRKPWQQQADDNWQSVGDVAALPAALGQNPRRVFLTLGRLNIAAFLQASQHHYLIRSIDPPAVTLPRQTLILARPPFTVEDETALMRTHAIDILVSKNSGGNATYAKIVAARALHIPVLLWQPPALPKGDVVYDIKGALDWLTAHVPPP